MMTEDAPLWMIIALAAGAAFVLFMLYSVLGKRVGRQPGDDPAPEAERVRQPSEGPAERPARAELGDMAPAAAAIRAADPAFDPTDFLEGARTAYATIVRAFAAGDRAALQPLLAEAVMTSFEAVMVQRESEGRTEAVEFLHPPRADLEALDVVADVARARVRFLGELRTRSKSAEGEAVDDRRTAEIWTFERAVGAVDPNWILVQVEAAQA